MCRAGRNTSQSDLGGIRADLHPTRGRDVAGCDLIARIDAHTAARIDLAARERAAGRCAHLHRALIGDQIDAAIGRRGRGDHYAISSVDERSPIAGKDRARGHRPLRCAHRRGRATRNVGRLDARTGRDRGSPRRRIHITAGERAATRRADANAPGIRGQRCGSALRAPQGHVIRSGNLHRAVARHHLTRRHATCGRLQVRAIASRDVAHEQSRLAAERYATERLVDVARREIAATDCADLQLATRGGERSAGTGAGL